VDKAKSKRGVVASETSVRIKSKACAIKKPKKPKKEKPFASGTMTVSAFFSFIRSGLRQKSRRWKPIYDCLAAARRPSQSANKRLKWEFQCAGCKEWFAQKQVSVDHIRPVGSLRSFDDLPLFVANLFCELENLQVLCTTCHLTKTDEDKE